MVDKKKKKELELSPKIEERIIENKDLPMFPVEDNSIVETEVFNNNNTDSYFKEVVNTLMSKKDISLKTEYLNVVENFVGAKLTFLSKFGNMPYINDFINTFETKRVSLNRKSRIEIIRALEKRDEEIKQQRANQLNSMFGY